MFEHKGGKDAGTEVCRWCCAWLEWLGSNIGWRWCGSDWMGSGALSGSCADLVGVGCVQQFC